MLLNGILLGGDGEVLSGGVGAVDAVGEAEARESDRVVTVEALGGDFDGKRVAVIEKFGCDLKVFRMAETVHVFTAKASHFASIKVLVLDGIKDEVVAEARDGPFGLEVAGVDEKFNAVTAAKVGFAKFLKRAVDVDVEGEALGMPGCANLGKRLFIQELICKGQKVGLLRLEVSFMKEAVGGQAKKLDG